MVAIWNNWKLDTKYVQQHLEHAREVASQTHAMIMQGAERSMHAFDNVNEAIDEALRGVSTMEKHGHRQTRRNPNRYRAGRDQRLQAQWQELPRGADQ